MKFPEATRTSDISAPFPYVTGFRCLTNQGLIQAINTGSTIAINPTGTFANAGTLSAAGGGTVTVTAGRSPVPNSTNTGTLALGTGRKHNLIGRYSTAGLNPARLART